MSYVIEPEKVELLVTLGLTINQAKIILALTGNSPLTAKEISKNGKVRSEIVYRNIPKLQEKGLVQKSITSPYRFQSVPLKNLMHILLSRKEKENIKIKKRVKKCIDNLDNRTLENNITSFEDLKIIQLPNGKSRVFFGMKRLQELENARSVDAVITTRQISSWFLMDDDFLDSFFTRDIKIRFIIYEETRFDPLLKVLKSLQEKNVHFKLTNNPLPISIGIYDKKEIMLHSTEINSNCYWTNEPCFVELAISYFENLWMKLPTC